MGIKHLWQHALAPCKDKAHNPPVPLSSFKNKRVGINLSVWIHEIEKKGLTSLQLYFNPSCQLMPSQFLDDIKTWMIFSFRHHDRKEPICEIREVYKFSPVVLISWILILLQSHLGLFLYLETRCWMISFSLAIPASS